MIRVFESFDHLAMAEDGTESNRTSYLWNLGWRFGTWQNLTYPPYGPFFTGGEVDPVILEGRGRFGTRALRTNENGWVYPPIIGRKCDTLVTGMCISGYDLSLWGLGRSYNNGPHLYVDFLYNEHLNFRVELWYTAGHIVVSCYTGTDSASVHDYPMISTPEYIPVPYFLTEFTFVEVYCDVTDFMNGRVKIAINNKTYVDVSGIATAAWKVFGSDPYDARAKINRVRIQGANDTFLYDTFYLCDDAGGYQNDFLGDVYMKTCYPSGDGVKSDWMPIENGSVKDAPGAHHEFIDDSLAIPGVEDTYLQADQDLSAEMMTFDLDPIPPESSLVAVNSRTMARNVATPGVPKFNSIVPLFQIQGNPILETNSLTIRSLDWAYFFLDVYYNLVPGFATPWAEYLLEQSQFGFLLRTLENLQSIPDEILWDDLIITQHAWDEAVAEDMGFLDNTAESASDMAVWDISVEDGFRSTEEPDYGEFFLDDALGVKGNVGGAAQGFRDCFSGGTYSASGSYDAGRQPEKAFDGDVGTGWLTRWGDYDEWLQCDVATPQAPQEFILVLDRNEQPPHSWKFRGAKADGVWITLDEQTNFDVPAGKQAHRFPLPGWNPNEAYSKFRLELTGQYFYYASVQEMKGMAPFSAEF